MGGLFFAFAALVLGDINTLGFCLACRNKKAGLDSGIGVTAMLRSRIITRILPLY